MFTAPGCRCDLARDLTRHPSSHGLARRQSALSVSPQPAMPAMDDAPAGAPVLVVFVDHTACWWLRLLRPGFRHCFVVLGTGPVWLACEPLKDRIELVVLNLPREFDLARFYHEQGHRVLSGQRPQPGPRRRFTLAPLTCVTVVKRVLAIDAPWVWTPSQLYAHLCDSGQGFVEPDHGPTTVPSTIQAGSIGAQLGA
jgi:hypothetical protein